MSASRTSRSVVTARAPGARTSTVNAISSADPDPEMATSYPAAIAARAIVVLSLPAPTMPRRRSLGSGLTVSPLGARASSIACGAMGQLLAGATGGVSSCSGDAASSSRTRGITSRPKSSIVAIRCSCGTRPMA
jgi:hypothetical protein